MKIKMYDSTWLYFQVIIIIILIIIIIIKIIVNSEQATMFTYTHIRRHIHMRQSIFLPRITPLSSADMTD